MFGLCFKKTKTTAQKTNVNGPDEKGDCLSPHDYEEQKCVGREKWGSTSQQTLHMLLFACIGQLIRGEVKWPPKRPAPTALTHLPPGHLLLMLQVIYH